jgi:hypothetical protein
VDLTGILPHSALAIPLSLGSSALSGLVNSGGRARRRAAVVLSLLTLVPPFLVAADQRVLRFIACLGTVLGLFRALDLYFDGRPWSAARRAWLMVAIFDARAVRFEASTFDRATWLRCLAFCPPTALGFWLVLTVDPDGTVETRVLRLLAGTLACYCSIEVAETMIRGVYALGGVIIPRVHFDPILSRSVGEFWGKRWNMVVHEMLRTHFYLPLVRRGHVRAGVLAAFGASALLHFWIIFVPLGLFEALRMASFFALQGLFMLLERALGVERWRRPLQHAWTVSCVLGTSPLFTEPMLWLMPNGLGNGLGHG